MRVGDLVKMKKGYSVPGFVIKVDKDFYGAAQAFKIFKKIERGHAIRSSMVDGIGPTKDGIRDRVLVLWPDAGYSYEDSGKLVIISEGQTNE